MPTEETGRLLEDLGRLKKRVRAVDPDARARFDQAIETLDRLSGRENLQSPKFERLVLDLLSRDPDVVVAREPRTAGSSFSPDFLVRLGDRTVLVEARDPSSRGSLSSTMRQLHRALPEYGADRGLLVVPQRSAADLEDLAYPGVDLITVDDLADALRTQG